MKSSGLVLFVCAGLLLSGGAILGGSTTWSLLRLSYYLWISDIGVEIGSGVLIVAGTLLCLPTCWLCTIVPYHPRITPLQGTLMCLATTSMLLLSLGLTSLTSLSGAIREPSLLNTSMLRRMAYDAVDGAVRSSFNSMQLELKCCGVQSYKDWYQYRRTLPAACCGRVVNEKDGDQCEAPTYVTGCLRPALAELRAYVNAMSILSSVIIVIMSVTLFTTTYLLVTSVMEREEARALKQQPLRIACVSQPSPLVSFTSPLTVATNPHM